MKPQVPHIAVPALLLRGLLCARALHFNFEPHAPAWTGFDHAARDVRAAHGAAPHDAAACRGNVSAGCRCTMHAPGRGERDHERVHVVLLDGATRHGGSPSSVRTARQSAAWQRSAAAVNGASRPLRCSGSTRAGTSTSPTPGSMDRAPVRAHTWDEGRAAGDLARGRGGHGLRAA